MRQGRPGAAGALQAAAGAGGGRPDERQGPGHAGGAAEGPLTGRAGREGHQEEQKSKLASAALKSNLREFYEYQIQERQAREARRKAQEKALSQSLDAQEAGLSQFHSLQTRQRREDARRQLQESMEQQLAWKAAQKSAERSQTRALEAALLGDAEEAKRLRSQDLALRDEQIRERVRGHERQYQEYFGRGGGGAAGGRQAQHRHLQRAFAEQRSPLQKTLEQRERDLEARQRETVDTQSALVAQMRAKREAARLGQRSEQAAAHANSEHVVGGRGREGSGRSTRSSWRSRSGRRGRPSRSTTTTSRSS